MNIEKDDCPVLDTHVELVFIDTRSRTDVNVRTREASVQLASRTTRFHDELTSTIADCMNRLGAKNGLIPKNIMNIEKGKPADRYSNLNTDHIPDGPAKTRPPANSRQVGGDHYLKFKHNPWDFYDEWGLSFYEGAAISYIVRHRHKNGIEDIEKAIHCLEKFVEIERAKSTASSSAPNGRAID